MIEIKIARDFTLTPGARTYADGPKSGQEFYETILRHKFDQAIAQKIKLRIDLDGTDGYASSFLNEAFSRLGNEFGADIVWENLVIISDEVPKYLKKVKESIYEKRN